MSQSDPGHVGPKIDPDWFDFARQFIIFGLGVWLIIMAVTTQGHDIPFLVTGLVLFGMVPFERLINRKFRKDKDAEKTD